MCAPAVYLFYIMYLRSYCVFFLINFKKYNYIFVVKPDCFAEIFLCFAFYSFLSNCDMTVISLKSSVFLLQS